MSFDFVFTPTLSAHESLTHSLYVMASWLMRCLVAQALHAFCLADVTLCMPPNDPASFARCLAPYLKVPPSDPALADKEKRRSAERLLCILAVISSLLCKLDRIAIEAAQDLESDLVQLISSHIYVQVGDALCTIASILDMLTFASQAQNMPCMWKASS